LLAVITTIVKPARIQALFLTSRTAASDKLLDKPCQTLFNTEVAGASSNFGGADLYMTVAHDKGKPAVRRGRKAVSLFGKRLKRALAGEIVWLPKAI
jgi:hypothetical protein